MRNFPINVGSFTIGICATAKQAEQMLRNQFPECNTWIDGAEFCAHGQFVPVAQREFWERMPQEWFLTKESPNA